MAQDDPDDRARTSSVRLELAGSPPVAAVRAAGGDLYGEAARRSPGPATPPGTLLSGVGIAPLTIELEPPAAPDLWAWVAATLAGTPARRSGAVVRTDVHGDDERIEFGDALLTGITVPAVQASVAHGETLTLTIAPEHVTRSTVAHGATGYVLDVQPGRTAVAGFRLEVDRTDCRGVVAVDELAVRLELAPTDVGASREPAQQAATLVGPDVVVTLGGHADDFRAWHAATVVQGTPDERDGTLTLLDESGEPALVVTFVGLGLLRLEDEPWEPGAYPRTRARLSCRRLRIEPGG